MIAKKRWLSKIYSDSQESSKSDISWVISDSDCEEHVDTVDPVHCSGETKNCGSITLSKRSNTWIKLPNSNVTPTKLKQSLDTIDRTIDCKRSDSDELSFHVLDESPIINALKQEEESPILTQINTTYAKGQSPIIGRRKYKKVKFLDRFENTDVCSFQIKEEDFELSQSSVDINIDSFTQCTMTKRNSPIKISPAKSEISQTIDILAFPSQNSSNVASDSSSNCASDPNQLYHQPPPRKRKFKNGGLARELHKAVNAYKASLAIWQHEVYLNTSKNKNVLQEDETGIEFCVGNKWLEYGCVVLKCKKTDNHISDVNDNNEDFLILVDNLCNIEFKENYLYKIVSPYEIKHIMFEQNEIICYFNASKFIKIK